MTPAREEIKRELIREALRTYLEAS